MEYVIIEGSPEGKYNASVKAREDIETIFERRKIEKYYINTKKGVQKSKIKKIFQYMTYIKNYLVWKKQMKKIPNGSNVFIQYPLINSTIGIDRIWNHHNKRLNIIAIIHDMDSLRYTEKNASKILLRRIAIEDKKALNSCNYIVCHNNKMKDELVKLGNKADDIFTIGLFDYIIADKIEVKRPDKSDAVIIAGNLSKQKCGYLKYLNTIRDANFNLYGVGYQADSSENNVNYKGVFKPDELIRHLEGSFGLVWDGDSKETCDGGFGNYLRYNNPHKASLYLAAGIPIITWEKAAIADIIKKYNIGIVVDNLDEIPKKIENLTDAEYGILLENAKKISEDLRNGLFFNRVLGELNNKIK